MIRIHRSGDRSDCVVVENYLVTFLGGNLMHLPSRATHFALVVVAVASLALAATGVQAADGAAELDRRMDYWRTRLPFCNWPGIARYPSKYDESVLFDDPDPLKGQCNDGDGVIFNGVLCVSGDDRGCDAVQRSQGPNGQFWRSPRKVGGALLGGETGFSPDHVLGVWAYVAQKRNGAAFRNWIDWIDGQPRPRVCEDDKCTFVPSDCPMLDVLALLVLESNKVCDPQHKVMVAANKLVGDLQRNFDDAIARLYKIPGSDILRPVVEPLKLSFNSSLEIARKANEKAEELRIQAATYARALSGAPSLIVAINALVNEPGPPQWDAAVEILLLKKFIGRNMPGFNDAASILALKQPQNPFFEYVAHGPTDRMLNQILSKCPAQENDPPHARFQWSWERVDDEQPPPWKQTMYWDCLAVANLYKNGPADAGELSAPDLSGAIKQAADALASAVATVKSIIESIEGLIKDCEKLQAKCAVSLLTAPLKLVEQEAKRALDQLSKGQIPAPIAPPIIALPASVPTPPLKKEADKVNNEIKKRTGVRVPSGAVTGIPGSPF